MPDSSTSRYGLKVQTDKRFFFTSRPGETEQALDERALGLIIKECITSANTLLFYLTSKNFLKSEFCMFEGGAGWATRAVGDYLKLNMEFESIPTFLTNGRSETPVKVDDTIELTLSLHNYIVAGVLNPMIDHLNRGRTISDRQLIDRFTAAPILTESEMQAAGKSVEDYFGPRVLHQWRLIVRPAITEYLVKYDASPECRETHVAAGAVSA